MMNDGIYGGTDFQAEDSESITTTAGGITLPADPNASATSSIAYDVFITVAGADVFETATNSGAGGAKTVDGSVYVAIGRYRAGSVISLRTAAGTATVTYTAKQIIG